MDKGSFEGDTIQETQPIYEKISYPPLLEKTRFYTAITGHILVLVAVLLLFLNQGFIALTISSLFSALFYPAMLWIFGRMLLTSAHIYWGEMQFRSYLIQFRGEGTYTESTYSTGMSIVDSTRSENKIVNTAYSPWLLTTQIISSTQAKPGASSFSNARYILSLEKADDMKSYLVDKMHVFLEEREMIVTATSKQDRMNIDSIQALNSTNNSDELAQQQKKILQNVKHSAAGHHEATEK